MLVLNAGVKVLDEIREIGHFGVIADEATDISKKEQMSIILSTCAKDYMIKSTLLEFENVLRELLQSHF